MHIYEDLYLKEIMKRKINENRKENKNYKYSILKTYKDFDNILMSDEIKSIKIILREA